MAAATLLAARQLKMLDSGQLETYSIATLINCRQFLEPALDDHNVGGSLKQPTRTRTNELELEPVSKYTGIKT